MILDREGALGAASATLIDPRLLDDREAFDSVAEDYDGPTGNNPLVQRMRRELWLAVEKAVPKPSRLLDLGCGTGIDAVHFATQGHHVLATDWAPRMVSRTRARAVEAGVNDRVDALVMGLHEVGKLDANAFDCIYSDLGPLNCALDLKSVGEDCQRILKPGGLLIASVIGRVCPWEFAYYGLKGDWNRARLRSAKGAVPVNLNGQTVWTRYYTPREFAKAFGKKFEMVSRRGLGLFIPPPYLIRVYERFGPIMTTLNWAEEHLGGLYLIREAGDHFLAVLRKRE